MLINGAIFDEHPRLGYGFKGFCDGKLGRPADPPKGEHRAIYMSEFSEGVKQRAKMIERVGPLPGFER